MGKGEKKHGAMARLKFKGRSDKEKKLEVKLISVKDAPMNQSELDSNCETKGMAGGREYQLASNETDEPILSTEGNLGVASCPPSDVSGNDSSGLTSMVPGKPVLGPSGEAVVNLPPKRPSADTHKVETAPRACDKSSDNKAATYANESKEPTTPRTAPPGGVSPSLLTKKPALDETAIKEPSENSPKPSVVSLEKSASEVSPKGTSRQERSTRKFLWLMVENIPKTLQTQSLEYKNNDILRWLDFDASHLEKEPAPLPVGRYLECETWSGMPVIVPSEYARLLISPFELAQVLQRRPRAEVIDNFTGTDDEELSVVAGEVVYLLFECDSTHFMAMNKSTTRGKLPKSVLNVLVAP